MAENVSKYLGKGSLVGITGELRGRKYEDKEGNKRYNYDLIANNVQFLDGVKKDTYGEEVKPKPKKKVETKPEPEDSYDNQEEEIPF
jgi:single-strand DNA-binding protein